MKMWCVKTPRGRLLSSSLAPGKKYALKREAAKRSRKRIGAYVFGDVRSKMRRMTAEGYTVVPVSVEEMK